MGHVGTLIRGIIWFLSAAVLNVAFMAIKVAWLLADKKLAEALKKLQVERTISGNLDALVFVTMEHTATLLEIVIGVAGAMLIIKGLLYRDPDPWAEKPLLDVPLVLRWKHWFSKHFRRQNPQATIRQGPLPRPPAPGRGAGGRHRKKRR